MLTRVIKVRRYCAKPWLNGIDRFYRVNLNPDQEILPLIGSKEGIMHICMTYVNEGDLVLVPNPGYPTYRSAARLAGARLGTMN